MPSVNIPEMPKVSRIDAQEIQLFFHQFFSSLEYRDNLKKRILSGKGAHMEILGHHMTYGKPKETLALQGAGDGEFTLIIGGVEVKRQVTQDGMVVPVEGGARRPIAAGTIIDQPGEAETPAA